MNKRKNTIIPGVFLIIFGLLVIFMVTSFSVAISAAEAKIPDDAQWRDGKVTEVISIEEDTETRTRKTSSGSKRTETITVYDCDVILEYTVDGKTYEKQHSFNDYGSKIRVGDIFYLKTTADQPERIYVVSTTTDENFPNKIFAVFYVIGAVIILGGIVVIVKAVRRNKKIANEMQNNNYTDYYFK